MTEKLLVISVLLILLIPMVLAFDTDITIKTKPNGEVDIRIYSNDMGEKLDEYLGATADKDGKILITHSSNRMKFRLETFIRGESEGILKKFRDIEAGREVYIDLAKTNPVVEYLDKIENETNENETTENETVSNQSDVNEEEVIIEEEVEKVNETKKITGFVSGAGKAIINSSVTYYIIAGLVAVALLIFIFRKVKSRRGPYINFRIKSDNEENRATYDPDDKLESAERKLEEARKEIDEIKNRKGKLHEARERFEKAKKEMEELEGD